MIEDLRLRGRRRLGDRAQDALHSRRRCAISNERALPVLQAAHIRTVSVGGQHRIDNGLLLRSDIHTLFDRGYISVTPQHRILVSKKLKEEFDNGEPYYPLAGQEIWLPPSATSAS